MAKPKKSTPTLVMLGDPSLPPEHKVEILKALASDPSPEDKATLAAFFDGYGPVDAESLHAAKVKELQEIIQHMEQGPLRQAAFVELIPTNGSAPKHAHVVLDTGEFAYPVVTDTQLGATLRAGDRVLLEGRGRALLHRASNGLRIGEEAVFERKLDERHLEVKTAADLRWVFLAAQDLMDQIDRVLVTALQQLDTTRPELKDKLIVVVATTNEPQCVDRAFFRRVGGTIERFGRLNRKACRAVLSKHLAGLPVTSHNGTPPEEMRHQLITDLTAWLFSPNGSEQGIVELTYAGSTTHEVRYRRDFLTGALVRGAVNQAAEAAAETARRGTNDSGVTLEQLMCAFDQQVRGVADQLSEHNAHEHLDVPDGARVAHLRRIPQPTLLPIELQRKENL